MKIAKYKDKCKGKGCIILAPGPSLNVIRPEYLKGLHAFACNETYLRAYTAPYWVTGDPLVLEGFRSLRRTTKLLAPHIFSTVGTDSDGEVYLDRKFLPNADEPRSHKHYPISFDLKDEIYEASNTAHLAMHIAVWMGFEKIFLIGADFGHIGGMSHFYGNKDSNLEKRFPEQLQIMEDTGLILEQKGIKVYNCSENSKIESFRFCGVKDAITYLRGERRKGSS